MSNPNSGIAPNDVISSADNYPVGGAGEQAESVETSSADPLAQPLDDQRERYLRLAAEYDNYRRRSRKELLDATMQGRADVIRGMLDSLNDLARFAHPAAAAADADTVIEGAAMVERNLMKALGSLGLEVIDPIGQPFDPSLHEAVSTEPAASPEQDHLVGKVYQPGYMLSGKLLRPASVVVKQWNG